MVIEFICRLRRDVVYLHIEVLDTTLRDGSQGSNVSFTPNDKIRIAIALDDLGVDYIEGGWPGSNPKDRSFFQEIKEYKLSHSSIAAFGSTKHKGSKTEDDPSIKSIIDSGAETAVIFGKAWELHVKDVLKVTNDENLDLIYDSVNYLKSSGIEVIFDAEHFYKGYASNSEYAMLVLKTAADAGSRTLVLCDTTGSTAPNEVHSVTKKVVENADAKVGVHMHNDIGCAVANTMMGVVAGARHIQGTVNGIGERSGNADIITAIPALAFSLGHDTVKQENLKKLKSLSSLLYSIMNVEPNPGQPFVGDNAFAHKGGIHVDAMRKNAAAYEHIDPQLVGNMRKIIISDMSGASNLLNYAEALGLMIGKSDARLKQALNVIKSLEKEGYSFDAAEASAMLIMLKEMGVYRPYIRLGSWKTESAGTRSMAMIKAGEITETAEGPGPVNAMDVAIRKAFTKIYPEISKVVLIDYRVVLPGHVKNTQSTVRVVMEFSDGREKWRSTGVSKNVINASLDSLLDGFNYYLWKNKVEDRKY
jgi:2-isopropylmalate synthase